MLAEWTRPDRTSAERTGPLWAASADGLNFYQSLPVLLNRTKVHEEVSDSLVGSDEDMDWFLLGQGPNGDSFQLSSPYEVLIGL